jgi:hypothetical protein
MEYHGSCHCGRIAFDAEGEIGTVTECNCSYCGRKGSLLWFVPQEKFRLKTPASNEKTYTFNKHVIQHRFCPECGCAPYSTAKDRNGVPTAAINVRCLEDVDISMLKRQQFDGRKL